MTDEEAAQFLMQGSEAEVKFAELAPLRPCPHCQFNLGVLPMSAKYCPHCGVDLSRPTVSANPVRVEYASKSAGAPLKVVGSHRSALVRGFAGALYRLGVRYEANLGARSNRNEAIRCYQKAAKLGDEQAMNRLNGPG